MSAGTLTFDTRDAWLMVATNTLNENFANPVGDSPNFNFGAVAITATGKSTATSSDKPHTIRTDTSFIDLFESPDGGNFIGTVGRTTLDTTTITTTNSEFCKNSVCTPGTPVQTVDTANFDDVRTLEIDFHYPVLNSASITSRSCPTRLPTA
jgi:hypothetical protein